MVRLPWISSKSRSSTISWDLGRNLSKQNPRTPRGRWKIVNHIIPSFASEAKKTIRSVTNTEISKILVQKIIEWSWYCIKVEISEFLKDLPISSRTCTSDQEPVRCGTFHHQLAWERVSKLKETWVIVIWFTLFDCLSGTSSLSRISSVSWLLCEYILYSYHQQLFDKLTYITCTHFC